MSPVAPADPAQPRFRPRNATDASLAALAHGVGLLGLTVAGWAVAAVVSIALIVVAGERRSAYLAGHAGQAALYQIAVAVLQALYVVWLVAGFLSFGGELPGVPDYRVFDLWSEPWVTIVQVAWGLSLLVWPLLSVGAVALAGVGALRAARGQRFWYPVVSRRIRRLVEGEPVPPKEEPEEPEQPEGSEQPEGPVSRETPV